MLLERRIVQTRNGFHGVQSADFIAAGHELADLLPARLGIAQRNFRRGGFLHGKFNAPVLLIKLVVNKGNIAARLAKRNVLDQMLLPIGGFVNVMDNPQVKAG